MSVISEQTTPELDRVRAHTPECVNKEIDQRSEERVLAQAARSKEEIGGRITELGREWDMERVLQANASALALAGVVLGAAVNKRFLVLPGVVFTFLFQHAVQGWCPPVSLFRRLGLRTRREINREKYALKAVRGDFDQVPE
jgi:hypothetical protein